MHPVPQNYFLPSSAALESQGDAGVGGGGYSPVRKTNSTLVSPFFHIHSLARKHKPKDLSNYPWNNLLDWYLNYATPFLCVILSGTHSSHPYSQLLNGWIQEGWGDLDVGFLCLLESLSLWQFSVYSTVFARLLRPPVEAKPDKMERHQWAGAQQRSDKKKKNKLRKTQWAFHSYLNAGEQLSQAEEPHERERKTQSAPLPSPILASVSIRQIRRFYQSIQN